MPSWAAMLVRVTPTGLAPVIRQAVSLERATLRASKEFTAGVETVEAITLLELAQMADAGFPLVPVAKAALSNWRAKLAEERAKAVRAAKRLQKARDAREAVRHRERLAKAQKAQAEKDRMAELKRQEREAVKAAERRETARQKRALAKAEKFSGGVGGEATNTVPLTLPEGDDGDLTAPW